MELRPDNVQAAYYRALEMKGREVPWSGLAIHLDWERQEEVGGAERGERGDDVSMGHEVQAAGEQQRG